MSWAAFKKGCSILGAIQHFGCRGIDALLLQTLPLISDKRIAAVGIAVVGIAACTRRRHDTSPTLDEAFYSSSSLNYCPVKSSPPYDYSEALYLVSQYARISRIETSSAYKDADSARLFSLELI
jgi:hypothetical protein